MLVALMSIGEALRLAALHAYRAFQTGPEPGFDRITSLAAKTLGVPTAYGSLVGEDTQWLKSCFNLPRPRETGRDIAFCAHAILCDDVFVVPDTHLDERFFDNPLVTGGPMIRFYAGCPLRCPSGHNVGTLCAVDTVPRVVKPEMLAAIKDLAALVVDQLELRKWIMEEESRQRHSAETNYRRLADAIHGMVFRMKVTGHLEGGHLYVSPGSRELVGVSPETFLTDPCALIDRVHPEDLPSFLDAFAKIWKNGSDWTRNGRVVTLGGELKWVQGEGRCERQPDGACLVEGLITDVTEAKRREVALQEAKRRRSGRTRRKASSSRA